MILPAEIVRQLTHDCREPKQARAEAQPGAFGRIDVDGEAHPAVVNVQLEDGARLVRSLYDR